MDQTVSAQFLIASSDLSLKQPLNNKLRTKIPKSFFIIELYLTI